MHWRRKWQPTPVFLPGESQGLGSLVGCRIWGRTESDMTERCSSSSSSSSLSSLQSGQGTPAKVLILKKKATLCHFLPPEPSVTPLCYRTELRPFSIVHQALHDHDRAWLPRGPCHARWHWCSIMPCLKGCSLCLGSSLCPQNSCQPSVPSSLTKSSFIPALGVYDFFLNTPQSRIFFFSSACYFW